MYASSGDEFRKGTKDNRSSNEKYDTVVSCKEKTSGFFGGKNGMVEQG